jgi:serine/threonine-protein kinase RsbW
MRQALQVAGTAAGARLVMEAFDGFCRSGGLAPDRIWELGVALDEVLSNAVGHGCAGRPDARLEVTFELLQGMFEVTVADDGPAFDPLSLPAPDTGAPLDSRQPGGLGIYLTRRLVDRVSYERRGEANRVVFSRRVTPADRGPGG